MDPEFPEADGPGGPTLARVGMYPSRTAAYDRALVLSAMGLPHWILRQGEQFALCTRPGDAVAAAEELSRFEAEGGGQLASSTIQAGGPKDSSLSLYVCAWIMGGFYAVQMIAPAWWETTGTADGQAIIRHGEWWRTVTALTLHADLGHLGANLAAGLVCAAFLLPIFGPGWTWTLTLLTGALGNALNSWGHPDHLSIGASTAVFGALGLLVSAQCAQRALALRQVRWREFLLPLGAGLGLLGYLGVGDEQTDYTAHFFGFLFGLALGAIAVTLHAGERTPRWLQVGLSWLAPLVLAAAWIIAGAYR